MKKRSKKFYFFSGLGLLIGLWAFVALFNTGGVLPTVDSLPEYTTPLARVSDMPGVSCKEHRIPIKLAADSTFDFDLVGQLCRMAGSEPATLQVLVSGAGYGSNYWDFPYKPDTYSYARAALRAGDAVFNFDRIGIGASDHPFGALLNVDVQAYTLHQALTVLAEAYDFEAVVTLGHSFGSVTALAHALQFPEQVDGVVLTGFIHNVNPIFGPTVGRAIDVAPFAGPFTGNIFDPTYTVSKDMSRGDVFYTEGFVEDEVLVVDNLTRQTTALGELITMSKYFSDQSKELQVPAAVIIGENDFVVCGGDLDCTDHAAVVANEEPYFPPASCLEVTVLDDTNHNANLHINAPEVFQLMQDWVARRVGSAGNAATDPCIPG